MNPTKTCTNFTVQEDGSVILNEESELSVVVVVYFRVVFIYCCFHVVFIYCCCRGMDGMVWSFDQYTTSRSPF